MLTAQAGQAGTDRSWWSRAPVVGALTADDPRIEKIPETGCWIWMRNLGADGYASTRVRGKMTLAHRAFYEEANGALASSAVKLDHLCRVRSCVNPDHLKPGTTHDNLFAPGSLSIAKAYAARTACPKCGGPFSPWLKNPRKRRCIPCDRDVQRYHREKRRDGATPFAPRT